MTDTQSTNHPPMVAKLTEAPQEVRDYVLKVERTTGLDRSTIITSLLMKGISKARKSAA